MAVVFAPCSANAISGFAPQAQSAWVEFGWSNWSADSQYAGPFSPGELSYDGGVSLGDRVPISIDEDGGTFSSTSLYLSFRITPVARFSYGAYFPIQQVSVLELPSTRTTTAGTGDVFAWIAYELSRTERVGVSLFGHVKVPTTQTTFESLTVPLSEGQVDIAVEQQTTFAPIPQLHISGRLLWRYRFQVEQEVGGSGVTIKPGNETELGIEFAGAPQRDLWLRATYNGLFAQTSEDRTVAEFIGPRERRQLHTAEFGAYVNFGRWIHEKTDGIALDAWYRHPLGGVDYLRGDAVGIGLAYGFNWGGSQTPGR